MIVQTPELMSKDDLIFYKKQLKLDIDLWNLLYCLIKNSIKGNVTYIEFENELENNKEVKKIDKAFLKLLQLDYIGNGYLGVLGNLGECDNWKNISNKKINKEKILKEIKNILKPLTKITINQYIKEYC